jgi:apolipoprotein N-acyltransferase
MFGEYIPLVDRLPLVKWFTPITSGYTPGDKFVPFDLANLHVNISTLICFEDTFPHLVRNYANEDTDFLLNLTSDAWFGEGAAQWQHAVSAIFRAVENDLPLLRCCNNGLTCWVDSRGRLRQIFRDKTGSVYGPGVMTAEISLLVPGEKRARTFYNEHGDWFGWSCVGIVFVSALVRTRRKTEAV